MIWNAQVINKFIVTLNNSKTVSEAVETFNMNEGTAVTPGALRAAFWRNEESYPSYYLDQTSSPTQLQEEAEHSLPSLRFSTLDNVYFYTTEESSVIITCEEMDVCLVAYHKEEGLNLTAQQVCLLAAKLNRELAVLSSDDWHFIFKEMGQTKLNKLDAPHVSNLGTLERFKEEREARAHAAELQKGSHELSYLRSQNEKLEKEIKALHFLADKIETIKVDTESFYTSRLRSPILLDREVPNTGGCVRVIMIPDLHAGKNVKTRGYGAKPQNVFDKSVLMSRMLEFADFIENLGNWGDVSHVYLLGLGDSFEALLANMREGQFMTMDAWGKEQLELAVSSYMIVSEKVVEMVKKHCYSSTEVEFVIQPGNHDRLAKDKASESEIILNYMFADKIATAWNNEDRITVKDGAPVVTRSFKGIGWDIVSHHGHAKIPKSYQDVTNMKDLFGRGQPRTLMLNAHLHNLLVETGHNWRRIGVSSICGNDAYNLEKLHRGSRPELMFIDLFQGGDRFLGPFAFKS